MSILTVRFRSWSFTMACGLLASLGQASHRVVHEELGTPLHIYGNLLLYELATLLPVLFCHWLHQMLI